ncbi:hypothetical protein VNO77_22827 [Canavalia gladiata]|uniref:Uncharacterized protein n=1 Tax=Canavalia gladiata TaxID=3824 RepID=A0AAN9L3C1_CANGL
MYYGNYQGPNSAAWILDLHALSLLYSGDPRVVFTNTHRLEWTSVAIITITKARVSSVIRKVKQSYGSSIEPALNQQVAISLFSSRPYAVTQHRPTSIVSK